MYRIGRMWHRPYAKTAEPICHQGSDDAWLVRVRRQTYGYLPSRNITAPLPVPMHCLVTEAHVCVNNLCKVVYLTGTAGSGTGIF